MGVWAHRGLLLASMLAGLAPLPADLVSGRKVRPSTAGVATASVGARVWVIAHTRGHSCTATLRIRAGDHGVLLRVRGTATRRYLTGLLASQRIAIRTEQPAHPRCRALVTATGTLGAGGANASGAGVVLGTFDVVGEEQMRAWAGAGGTAVVVPVIWSQAQPTARGNVNLQRAGNSGQNVLAEVVEAHAAGLQVYLELDLQYPPEWVTHTVPQYVDQFGEAFSSQIPGQDVRDWVWAQTGREAVASFVAGALGALAPELSDVAGIRVGGGANGEMQYPRGGSTVTGEPSFWGYDTPAQSGAGIAEGEQATPLRRYVYGHGSAAQDSIWAAWYERSLGQFVHWYVTRLRAGGWQGPVYVLEPSYGVRENWSPRSPEYELQVALGTDYAVQLDSYDTLANVWPWSTWADDPEPYYHPGDPIDSDMAAWRQLLVDARERGIASNIMGENTGGGGAAAIARMTTGAMRAGYRGIFYLDYPALTAAGGFLLGTLTSSFETQLSDLGR